VEALFDGETVAIGVCIVERHGVAMDNGHFSVLNVTVTAMKNEALPENYLLGMRL
jgi:hypothetical protein